MLSLVRDVREETNYSNYSHESICLQLFYAICSIFLFGYAKENIVKSVRIDTFASVMRQEQAFFDKRNTGDLISRLTADCGEMAGELK